MPNVQFKCECGHEFEQLMQAHKEVWKWCSHCNRLTLREIVKDEHSQYYKQVVCVDCLGNESIPPLLPVPSVKTETRFTTECPICGKDANQILRFREYGRNGGSTVADSSIRFHFNYLPASDN